MLVKYYSKAIQSPLGQQVRDFYTSTSKQISDIHEEARRIASQQKEKAASRNSATAPDATKPVEESTGGDLNPATDVTKVPEPVEPKADAAAAPSKSDL
jgi:hypothetical protein